MPGRGSWARGRAPGGRRSSGARPRAGVVRSAPPSLLGGLLQALLGLLLRLGGPLLGVLDAFLGRVGGPLRRAAGAVAHRRLALGVDRGEQQTAQQAEVLQEVDELPLL